MHHGGFAVIALAAFKEIHGRTFSPVGINKVAVPCWTVQRHPWLSTSMRLNSGNVSGISGHCCTWLLHCQGWRFFGDCLNNIGWPMLPFAFNRQYLETFFADTLPNCQRSRSRLQARQRLTVLPGIIFQIAAPSALQKRFWRLQQWDHVRRCRVRALARSTSLSPCL